MAPYSDEYLILHDIDWFCIINDTPIHAASNGGTLPSYIKNHPDVNIKNQEFAYSLDKKYEFADIGINTDYIDEKFANIEVSSFYELLEMKINYLRSFVDMASRGFYSFDRIDYNNFESNNYILIAWPKHPDNSEIMNHFKNITFIINDENVFLSNSLKPIDFGNIKRILVK